jgi:Family of unknown function (DUF6152)
MFRLMPASSKGQHRRRPPARSASGPPDRNPEMKIFLTMKAVAMRNRLILNGIIPNAAFVVGLLIVSVPLLAHHGNAAFDTTKKVSVAGTVTEWRWGNPHCYVKVDAKDDKGKVIHWIAEAENPPYLTTRGWSPRDIKVGDEITLTLTVAKNGTPIGRVLDVTFADGRTLPSTGPDIPSSTPNAN